MTCAISVVVLWQKLQGRFRLVEPACFVCLPVVGGVEEPVLYALPPWHVPQVAVPVHEGDWFEPFVRAALPCALAPPPWQYRLEQVLAKLETLFTVVPLEA